MNRLRRLAAGAVMAALVLSGPTPVPDAAAHEAPHARGDGAGTVVSREVIGHSVRGRPITAYELGEPRDPDGRPNRRVLLIAEMHGDEQAPHQVLEGLVHGAPVHGLDLWVVPTYNPDGVAAHSRRNAHGVDLNRNFRYHWADLDGSYESGARPESEPETRAMVRFLTRLHPSRILSFHQPLNGVDTDTKVPGFGRRVARALHLPRSTLDCGGVCHGTMTSWYNHRFPGCALTVEYGAHPGRHRMRVAAPRQLLHLFGATRG